MNHVERLKSSQLLRGLREPKAILSSLGFQLVWWQLLIFVSQGAAALGASITIAYVILHLSTTAQKRWRKELAFILVFASLGWLGDVILCQLSLQHFSGSTTVPFWMFCLWLSYMTSIHYSMSTLFAYPKVTLFMGFIFGPWTYWACEKLGLVEFPQSTLFAGVVQGLIWMSWMWVYRYVITHKYVS